MTRYLKTPVTQLSANESAALQQINKNLDDIQSAIKDTVSRSGQSPTQMTADLDLNGKRIINAPAPLTDNDFVRRVDVVGDVAMVQQLVNAASTAAGQAIAAAEGVQEAIADAHVGIVADDLILGDNSKIRIAANNIDTIDACVDDIEDIKAVGDNISNVNAVADNETNINAVNNNKTNINAVAGNKTNIDKVADISTDVSTVANNVSNVSTVVTNMNDIKDCADNMSSITGASTQAANAAASAQSAADSAALAYQYGNDKINQTHISNCITYIPQDIKLELDNGTLTLKAGSKVYVPNGDGVFDAVNIESDLSTTRSSNIQEMYFVSNNGIVLNQWNNIYSGTSAPSGQTYMIWYDTANNIVKATGDGGSTWTGGFSLPICLATSNNAQITSIDQVFNGFGYIGSTVFALPGVKALAPNGRNADGTLNNSLCETSAVSTQTYSTDNNYVHIGIRTNGTGVSINGAYKYDEIKNMHYNGSNLWNAADCGVYRISGGKVTNFNQKTAFRALDYSDSPTISGWAMPSSKYIDLTLGASGTEYTAPANGYFYLAKSSTASGQTASIRVYIDGTTNVLYGQEYSSWQSNVNIKYTWYVRKGTKTIIDYTLGGSTNDFRFIYAEGEPNV